MPTILIAGVSGLVGFAAAKHFARLPGWKVIAVSRRRPEGLDGVEMISVDLTDSAGNVRRPRGRGACGRGEDQVRLGPYGRDGVGLPYAHCVGVDSAGGRDGPYSDGDPCRDATPVRRAERTMLGAESPRRSPAEDFRQQRISSDSEPSFRASGRPHRRS